MMQFFILGRNPELSRAEIFSYFKEGFREVLFKENFLILDFETPPVFNIQDFGGVLSSGKILFKGNLGNFRKFLEKEEVIPEDKFTWAILGNFEDAEDWLIDKFKKDRKKAMIRRTGKDIELQSGEILQMGKAEFQLFCFFSTDIFFGLVENEYSYDDVKKRDMQKPERRESLAISPRLAKILVNLSGAKKGDTMLDPFCGIGAILIEALLKGVNVVGVDRDKEAIYGAKRNLTWLGQNYKIGAKFQLIEDDSARVRVDFDCVASETELGELFKGKISRDVAEKTIIDFENKIIPVLRNLKQQKLKEAKIAITFPFVRESFVDWQRVCRETGLKLFDLPGVKFPIKEFREDQFVSREFFVFI